MIRSLELSDLFEDGADGCEEVSVFDEQLAVDESEFFAEVEYLVVAGHKEVLLKGKLRACERASEEIL